MTPVLVWNGRIRTPARYRAGKRRKKPFFPMPSARRKMAVCNGKGTVFTIFVLRIFTYAQHGFPVFRR